MTPGLLARRWRDRRTGREASSLLDLDDGRPFDPVGVATLLAYGGLVGRRSLLVDVEAVITPLELQPPELHPANMPSADARADRLWALLCGAVQDAVAGRSRVRAALSGGLDSRAVCAAAVAVGAPGLTFGTFGDADTPDLAVAHAVAERLGRPHQTTLLSRASSFHAEGRVWRATDGTGGPASAPGAPTDADWADDCDVLLSGCSGDVIWGDTAQPGPSPQARIRKLGVRAVPEDPVPGAPPPPEWVSRGGAAAWVNLHTRQRGVTWNGVLPRLAYTPVVPVVWHPPLLAFALALPPADRVDRALVLRMLKRHAPIVSPTEIRLVKTGGVHDLDRAWREDDVWGRALDQWAGDEPREVAAFAAVGLDRPAAVRMIKQVRRGRRVRAKFLSRLRALRRWGLSRV